MARRPAAAAPYTMLMAATSLSACRKTPSGKSRSRQDRYSMTSLCGVMGYPKKQWQPARTVASAKASHPFIKCRVIPSLRLLPCRT